ncbi:PHP domain-containing protein [Zophobihabitans entericus]|uniref:PHP domain-containing protein n=1 Tax=Zophobihabitans entericus TaxID=1635327 RepID=A0A6G9ICI6_9GAMM|nr:PHP domain-containing protein [Zophobihabitans entericus]QIQ21529.1 PHP domain-containing protein [Zophobihabitans entericus]
MQKNIIDLHMHSAHSDDGEFTPTELVKMCAESGLKYFALTDHNSTKGTAEAYQAAQQYGLTLISGIEIDCVHEGTHLHVLGYGVDPNYPAFAKIEADILKQEQQKSVQRVGLVEKLGIYINHDKLNKLSKHGVIIGEMIAEASIYEPENKDHPLTMPYLAGGKRSNNPYVNFHWDFCAPGKPAHVAINYISLNEAIKYIVESGGIPVLAHPGNNIHESEKLLVSILAQGVKGIEVYSSYHSEEQIQFYLSQAQQRGCLITCGSDFHGKTKPSIKLGDCRCSKETEQTLIQKLAPYYFKK